MIVEAPRSCWATGGVGTFVQGDVELLGVHAAAPHSRCARLDVLNMEFLPIPPRPACSPRRFKGILVTASVADDGGCSRIRGKAVPCSIRPDGFRKQSRSRRRADRG